MNTTYVDIGVPAGMQIYKDLQHLRIIRRWFHWKYVPITLFVIFWDSFLVAIYWSALTRSPIDITFVLFPILHLAVGVGLTYFTLAGYLNSTVIDVDGNVIRVRHGPIPWWGNQRISSRSTIQLYSKEEHWSSYRSMNSAFQVRAITNARRNLLLVSGLDHAEQALFIEQEIEKFLNIEDRPVRGEIR